MDLLLRAFLVYGFLFVILRVSGKRSMADITPFNFILLLMISEATQQALLGNDFSIVTAFIVIAALVGMDLALALLKQHFPKFALWLEGTPLVLVEQGKLMQERLKKTHVDEADILESARRSQGLESLDQIKYAVLEKSGGITVVPKKS